MQSTRQIFDKLSHSSTMKLNESSMDKARPPAQPPLAAPNPCGCHVWRGAVPGAFSPSHAASSHAAPRHTLRPATPRFLSQLFDLMTMGFKYQLIACRYPQELLHVTLNHLHQAPPHPPPPLCTSPHLLSAHALHWHYTGTALALHWHCTPPRRSAPLGTPLCTVGRPLCSCAPRSTTPRPWQTQQVESSVVVLAVGARGPHGTQGFGPGRLCALQSSASAAQPPSAAWVRRGCCTRLWRRRPPSRLSSSRPIWWTRPSAPPTSATRT